MCDSASAGNFVGKRTDPGERWFHQDLRIAREVSHGGIASHFIQVLRRATSMLTALRHGWLLRKLQCTSRGKCCYARRHVGADFIGSQMRY